MAEYYDDGGLDYEDELEWDAEDEELYLTSWAKQVGKQFDSLERKLGRPLSRGEVDALASAAIESQDAGEDSFDIQGAYENHWAGQDSSPPADTGDVLAMAIGDARAEQEDEAEAD